MINWNRVPRVLLALTVLLGMAAGLVLPWFAGQEASAAPVEAPLLICPATTITQWTFTGDVATPSTGSGVFASGTSLVPAGPPYTYFGGPADSAISFSSWASSFDANDYLEFAVDTTGKVDIGINFSYRSTSSGPNALELHYSTDGTSFTQFGSPTALTRDSNFYPLSFDLTSIAGLNNNPNAEFRIYAYGATSSAGTFRADNVTLTEVCIPPTPTETGTATETGTPTSTPTVTQTPTCTTTSTTIPLSIVINEVAWAGTAASIDDEWIELYNPVGGVGCILLDGWVIRAEDGTPTINLTGPIQDDGYFLLERTDNSTISDIAADQIYSGDLSNNGEKLYLENNGIRIDSANIDGGSWPAGTTASFRSMERWIIAADSPTTWITNIGTVRNGVDAGIPAGCGTTSPPCTTIPQPINGTPRQVNWSIAVTPTSTRTATPTRTPTKRPTFTRIPPVVRPIINEFLPRPGFDWNQDGNVDVFDEFIEIKNIGVIDVNLGGWKLDDEADLGSNPFVLPNLTLKPGERMVYYGLQTNILLSDGGDSVRLINPSGKIYDAYTYSFAEVEDESTCRLPDGFGSWFEDCTPTPAILNTRDGVVPVMPQGDAFESPVCDLPDTLPSDFLFAECRGYGANIWRSFYWDQSGWQGDQFVPENMSKWESFVE